MIKKIYSFVLFVFTAMSVSAQEFIVDGINYVVDDESADKSEVFITLLNDFKYYGNVVIPPTVSNDGKTYKVTAIGKNAFNGCNSLLSVQFPECITYIGAGAFQNCNNLKQIVLPAKLETIMDFAFAQCSKITKVIIPNSVTEIGFSAFSECKKLSSVTIGSGMEVIKSNTFNQCTALKTITIPATVSKIEDKAFSNSGLTTVTFAGKNTEHTDYAFSSTPWFSANSQRTKAIMGNSRYHVKAKNVVTY